MTRLCISFSAFLASSAACSVVALKVPPIDGSLGLTGIARPGPGANGATGGKVRSSLAASSTSAELAAISRCKSATDGISRLSASGSTAGIDANCSANFFSAAAAASRLLRFSNSSLAALRASSEWRLSIAFLTSSTSPTGSCEIDNAPMSPEFLDSSFLEDFSSSLLFASGTGIGLSCDSLSLVAISCWLAPSAIN